MRRAIDSLEGKWPLAAKFLVLGHRQGTDGGKSLQALVSYFGAMHCSIDSATETA